MIIDRIDIAKLPRIFGTEYDNHPVFDDIEIIENFYAALSLCSSNKFDIAANLNNSGIFSISPYVFDSIQGTFESISVLLHNGRCNDAFALVRKYCDAIILDVYKDVLNKDFEKEFCEHFDTELLKKNKIAQWIAAENSLFNKNDITDAYRKIAKGYPELTRLFKLNQKSLYQQLRDICNDNMHYNHLFAFMSNDAEIIRARRDYRQHILKNIRIAIRYFFTIHFAFIYVGNTLSMISTDYVDYLDCGQTPPKGSERWVTQPVRTAFGKIIKHTSPKVAQYLLELDYMDLND